MITRLSDIWGTTVLPLCLLATLVTSNAQELFGSTFTGDGTSYGPGTGGGHCSYQISGASKLPWHTGVNYWAASGQYNGSRICGLCFEFRGTQLIGSNIPTTLQYGQIADECPECSAGSLDFQNNFGSRNPEMWLPVQCSVGTSYFSYSFQGSNLYYLKLQVANTRVPVDSVRIRARGPGSTYQPAIRSSDNYFILTGNGPYQFPLGVEVTSILGDTVMDTIHTQDPSNGALLAGSVQFPLSAIYSTVGGSPVPIQGPTFSPFPAIPPPPAVRSSPPLPAGSPPHSPPARASQPPSTAGPKPPPQKPPPPPLSPPPRSPSAQSPPPLSPPPRSPSAQSPPPLSRPPPPRSSPPPRSPPPQPPQQSSKSPPPFPNCTHQLQPYAQCGGQGGSCVGANCADKQIAGSCCLPTNSNAFFCSRSNQFYWQCIPELQQYSLLLLSESDCSLMVAPFGSCGKPDSCFPAPRRRLDFRFSIANFGTNVTGAKAPPTTVSGNDSTALNNRDSSYRTSAPSPPHPLAAGDKVEGSARDLDGVNRDGRTQLWDCQEQRFLGSCCAPGGTDAFSCIMVPQSAALTAAVDLQWRCLPTVSLSVGHLEEALT